MLRKAWVLLLCILLLGTTVSAAEDWNLGTNSSINNLTISNAFNASTAGITGNFPNQTFKQLFDWVNSTYLPYSTYNGSINQGVRTTDSPTFDTVNSNVSATTIISTFANISGTNLTEAPCSYGMGGDYSYLICTDGASVYAKNGSTGKVEFSGTDAGLVANQATAGCPSGVIERYNCYIEWTNGKYNLSTEILIDRNVTHVGNGYYTHLNATSNKIFNLSSGTKYTIDGFRLSGTTGVTYGIFAASNSNISTDVKLKNLDIGNVLTGIYIGRGFGNLEIDNVIIQNASSNGIFLKNVHSNTHVRNTRSCNPIAYTNTSGYPDSNAIYLIDTRAVFLEDLDLCGFRYGVRVDNGLDTRMDRVRPNVLDKYGIWVQNSNFTSIIGSSVLAIGQTSNFTGHGIVLQNTHYTTLDNNLFADSDNYTFTGYESNVMDYGITVYGNYTGLSIDGTTFEVGTGGFTPYNLQYNNSITWGWTNSDFAGTANPTCNYKFISKPFYNLTNNSINYCTGENWVTLATS